jgi:integrase
MLLLTGQRREEVGELPWTEISPDLATWTLPKERAKNKCANLVPLSTQARAILAARPRGEYVFPGDRGNRVFNSWAKSKTRLDQISGVTNWRLHDLRRTCATGLQRLGVRLEVTEAVLNHVSGSRAGIVGVYQQHDWKHEKRAALQAWGDRVQAIVEGRFVEEDNVVSFEARR